MFTRDQRSPGAGIPPAMPKAPGGSPQSVDQILAATGASQVAVGAANGDPAPFMTVTLSRPLNTHKGAVSVIPVRAPTFLDYIDIGDIDTVIAHNIDEVTEKPDALEVKTNHAAILRWAVALTGIDRIVLSSLPPVDAGSLMRAVRQAVAPFSQGNSSRAPTSSSSTSA